MRALLAHLRPYRGSIALTLTLLLVQSLAELGLPTLMAGIIDHGVLGANPAAIWLNGAGMLAVSLLSAAAALASSYVSARLGAGYGRDLRSAVFARITHLPPERFELFGAATLITRTTNDVTQVQGFVVMALRMLASAPLMAAGGVIMALLLDAPLAVVLLVAVPVLGLLIATVARRGVVLFRVVQEKIDRLNQVLRETLTGVRVIRAFDRQAQDAERFDRANLDLSDISLRTARLMAFVFPGLMLAMSLTSIALVWFGGLRIQAGHLPVGGLLAFIQYTTMILFSLMMMSILFVVLPRAAVSAGRINEVLDLPPEPAAGPPTAKDAPADRAGPGASSLEFRDVTFRYPGAEVPALDKVSFRVAPGSVAALIGGTGAGKTTVLQLLLRFHEAGEGQVLVDGRDVRTWDKAALRARFGLAPQKARLFTGTIAANLRWARPEASDQELAEALVTSQAASFVAELPDGTEHRIDKGGVNLSGGQRQRISLARALLRRPPVLLFDDSFSALDARTEADLREAVRARAAGSTVLVVAQRVSSVRGADQIIVLEDGRVAATGTHRELLASSAVYREIAASQEPEETP